MNTRIVLTMLCTSFTITATPDTLQRTEARKHTAERRPPVRLLHRILPAIQDAHGDSPLHRAVRENTHSACAEILTQCETHFTKMRPNAAYQEEIVSTLLCSFLLLKNNDGLAALHLAAQRGDVQIIEELMLRLMNLNREQQASILRQTSDTGASALAYAAEQNHAAVCLALIKRNAQVNAQDHQGDTPLHKALRSSATATVRTLLEHGADTQLRNKARKNAWDELHGNVNASSQLKTLLAYYGGHSATSQTGSAPAAQPYSKEQRNMGFAALAAYKNNDMRLCMQLLQQGADPTVYDQFSSEDLPSRTLVMHALHDGNLPVVRHIASSQDALLRAAYARSTQGTTLLHDLVCLQDIQGIQTLMALTIQDEHYCKEVADGVHLLLTTPDNLGETPLMKAIAWNQHDAIRHLLAQPVDLLDQNKFGHTVLHIATFPHDPFIITHLLMSEPTLLERRSCTGQTAFENAWYKEDTRTCNVLALAAKQLGRKVDISCMLRPHSRRASDVSDLVFSCAAHGHETIVEMLLPYALLHEVSITKRGQPILPIADFLRLMYVLNRLFYNALPMQAPQADNSHICKAVLESVCQVLMHTQGGLRAACKLVACASNSGELFFGCVAFQETATDAIAAFLDSESGTRWLTTLNTFSQGTTYTISSLLKMLPGSLADAIQDKTAMKKDAIPELATPTTPQKNSRKAMVIV